MSLVADCTTDTTIGVEDGWTLDGKGFTITAVDVPAGTAFTGAVVQNDGTAMNVKNLKIEGGDPNNCVAIFNGVAFMNAGGSIKNVTLNNIGQTTGCQSGRAIIVENTDGVAPRRSVAIENNTVSALQQERDRRARQRRREDHREHRHGQRAESTYIAQNGIVVYGADRHGRAGRGQHGQRERTTPGRPTRMPPGSSSSDATVTIDRKNTLSGNEIDIDNEAHHHGK